MSVDLFTLSEVKDLYGLGQFLPFMLFDTEVYSTTKDLHGFSLAEHFVPLVRYIGRRDQWKTADIIDPEHRLAFRYHGFRGMDLTWNNDLVNARNAQGSYEVTVHPKSVSLFHQFLKESKENGIEVVLVWTPEHVSGRHFVQNRSTVHGLHERIAEQYGLLFLDYTNDPICEDQRLFYNSLHLNKAGAERFTQKLIMDLQTHGRWPSTTRATS